MRRVVIGLSLFLICSLIPAHSATPPKAGSVCSKQGVTKTYKGKKYTCVKSGKKLVWSKGVVVTTPTSTPTSTPTPTPTSQANEFQNLPCVKEGELIETSSGFFRCEKRSDTGLLLWNKTVIDPTPSPSPSVSPTTSRSLQKKSEVSYLPPTKPSGNIDDCKIRQSSNQSSSGARSGFPRIDPPLYANTGTIKWALVPIDFSDLPGEFDFLERVREQMNLATEWVDIVTEGKVKIVWEVQKDWVRVPGTSKDYEVPLSVNLPRPEIVKIWNTFISESDKVVNYKDVQAVHFILPKGQTFVGEAAKGYAWDTAVKDFTSNEGSKIGFFTIPGVFYDRSDLGRQYWSYWVKEYSRGLGAGAIGASRVSSSFQTYDIQGNTDGERELSGWLRFLLGWLPDERVYCQQISNVTSIELTLVPLSDNSKDGLKVAIIPLSESKAIVVESRRETKFACLTPTQRDGLFVYVYDAMYGNGQEYLSAIIPSGRKTEGYNCATNPSADPLLHEGDSITFEGVKIELLLHGSYDRIRISR